MLGLIHERVQDGSQFVIATHSPIVLAYPSSLLYELSAVGIVTRRYEETSSYCVMRSFLTDRERFLAALFNPEAT
jgi:predicted ATPase